MISRPPARRPRGRGRRGPGTITADLAARVPDGQVTGSLELDGRTVAVSGWRGTVG